MMAIHRRPRSLRYWPECIQNISMSTIRNCSVWTAENSQAELVTMISLLPLKRHLGNRESMSWHSRVTANLSATQETRYERSASRRNNLNEMSHAP